MTCQPPALTAAGQTTPKFLDCVFTWKTVSSIELSMAFRASVGPGFFDLEAKSVTGSLVYPDCRVDTLGLMDQCGLQLLGVWLHACAGGGAPVAHVRALLQSPTCHSNCDRYRGGYSRGQGPMWVLKREP